MVNVEKITLNLVLVIVAVILIFNIVGETASDITDAADNISSSGLPLAGLFSSNGVVLLIFMAGLLIGLVVLFLKKQKHT